MSQNIARRLDRLEAPNGDRSILRRQHLHMLQHLTAILSRIDGTPQPDDAELQAEAERLAQMGVTPATLWFEAMDAAQTQ